MFNIFYNSENILPQLGGEVVFCRLNFKKGGYLMLKKRITMLLVLLFICFSVAVTSEASTTLAGGGDHSLALKPDGTVWTWGLNDTGQLGDGTTISRCIPVQVQNLTNIVAVIGGRYNHSLALKSDGTVWAWGNNGHGQLGDGYNIDRYIPVQVEFLSDAKAIAGGGNHSLALRTDGTVWAWGYNNYGQLGDITSAVDRYTVIKVKNLTDVVAIAGGGNHSLALKSDGTVWAWGYNGYGQLGDGTTTDRYTPVQVQNISDVVAIAGGADHSLALKSDGTVWVWGCNGYGQLGDGTTIDRYAPVQVQNISDVVAIVGGSYHSLVVKTDGTVWAWGYNDSGQLGDGTCTDRYTPAQVGNLTNIVAIAGGCVHSLALDASGLIWAWGKNDKGQLGDSTTTERYSPVSVSNLQLETYEQNSTIPIAAGYGCSFVMKKDNTLWSWGSNIYGKLGDGTTINKSTPNQIGNANDWKQISILYEHTVALKEDGSLWAWGSNKYGQIGNGSTSDQYYPIQIGSDKDWEQVAAGYHHTIALKKDGTLWGWGSNSYGQLGDSTYINKLTPVQIGTDIDWKCIAVGSLHTVALKKGGSLWVWGDNRYNQLSEDTILNKNIPIRIGTDTNWIAISSASAHTLALKSDGTLWGWGLQNYGELGDGTTIRRPIPVQIGIDTDWESISAIWNHSAAIKKDGSLWTWGWNHFGQLGDGTTTDYYSPVRVGTDNNWAYVAGGDAHTIAAKKDGSVWSWGFNNLGQLGDGTLQNQNSPKCIAPADFCKKDIKIEDMGKIEGYAFYPDKTDHTGIIVSVADLTTFTDSNGYYCFSNIPVGKYVLKIEIENYYSNSVVIEVKSNTNTLIDNINLYLCEVYGSVAGYIRYIDNNNGYGIAVKIQTLDGEPLPDLIAETDENGYFYFPQVPVDSITNLARYIFTAFALGENMGYSTDSIEYEVKGGEENSIETEFILRPAGTEVMVFADDITPWDSNALSDMLNHLNVPYSIYSSADIPNIILPINKIVWIVNDQPQSFYNTYAAYQSKFDDFVSNGGTLLFEACDKGWNGGSLVDAGGSLPSGVVNNLNYSETNTVTNPTHPMMTGIAINLTGNYASHNYFTNLPTGHTYLTVDNENNPTLVEYRYNLGRVIAAGQPLEFYWNGSNSLRQIYPNIIYYTFNLPINGVVSQQINLVNVSLLRNSANESIK